MAAFREEVRQLMPVGAMEAQVGARAVAGYFPVSIRTLQVDEVTDFELYLPPPRGSGEPVLYRHKNLTFTPEARNRLLEHDIEALYVKEVERAEYQLYLERRLGEVLRDPDIPLEERSAWLYESAQGLVHEVLADPRSGDVVARSGDLVEHAVGFLFRERNSFQYLVNVTSYDYYTYTHSVDVFVYAAVLAQALGYTESAVRRFGQGALLHDIGKCRIESEVVNCSGRLTPEQWAQMQNHPSYGYDILMELKCYDAVVLDTVRHHHEKLNGRGYPDGLPKDQVSEWARICAIADIFDALTTRRSYKDAMGTMEALQLMHREMREELDMRFFRTFVGIMGRGH